MLSSDHENPPGSIMFEGFASLDLTSPVTEPFREELWSSSNDLQPEQRILYLFATSVPIRESANGLVLAARMTTLL